MPQKLIEQSPGRRAARILLERDVVEGSRAQPVDVVHLDRADFGVGVERRRLRERRVGHGWIANFELIDIGAAAQNERVPRRGAVGRHRLARQRRQDRPPFGADNVGNTCKDLPVGQEVLSQDLAPVEAHRTRVHAQHVEQILIGVAGADVRRPVDARDPCGEQTLEERDQLRLECRAADRLFLRIETQCGHRQHGIRRLPGADRGKRPARDNMIERPAASDVDLVIGECRRHHLLQEVAERRRPQRCQHVGSV